MGVVLVILSIVALLSIFADAGLTSAMAKRLSEVPNEATDVIVMTLKLMLPTLLIASIATYAFADSVASLLGLPNTGGDASLDRGIVVSLLVAAVILKVFTKAFEGLRRVDISSMVTIAIGWAPWALAVLSIAMAGEFASVALVGKLAGEAIWVVAVAAALVHLLVRNGLVNVTRTSMLDLLRYAVPMAIVASGVFLYTQSGILVVQYYLDSESAGIFGTALRFVELLHVPAAAVGTAVAATFVHYASSLPSQARALYATVVRIVLVVYVPTGVGLFLLAGDLIPFIFGTAYLESAIVVRWFVPFLLLNALSATTSLTLVYLGFAGRRALLVVVSALANIILMIWLVPNLGVVGASLATLLSYAPLAFWYQWRLAKAVGAPLLPPRTRRIVFLATTLGGVIFVLDGFFTIHPVLIGVSFAVAYLVGVIAVRAVTREDLATASSLRG